ncbi:MAG: peptidase MA family metallohydrolase [Syntrophales bacterium]|jgi:hypothetical protein|nr:peptidase MA family metallohydrolase [Syntrophales bacterium]
MYRFLLTAVILLWGGILPSNTGAETFLSRQTEHFILTFTAQDEKIAARLIHEIGKIRQAIIRDTGHDFPGKTVVLIAPTIESFQKLQPAGARIPLWAAGVAYPEQNLIILRSPFSVKTGHPDIIETFAHEFSHIALGQTLPGQTGPLWLAEGLAMYQAREWDFSRTAVLVRGVLTGRLIPLRQLTSAFPSENERAQLAYAESFMFISFLINRIGRDAFHRFLLDYSLHGDTEGALRRATGLSLAALEANWLLYLKMRISWFPIVTSATTLWFVAAVIFIAGYIRKRKQGLTTLRRWEEEENTNAGINKGEVNHGI